MPIRFLYAYMTDYIFPKPILIPLVLSNFTQIKVIKDDNANNIPNGHIRIDYYDKLNNNKHAGYITYRVIGQVGLFYLDKSYQNRGLGKQILLETIKDMKRYNTAEIWAVTSQDHPFWSNVFNKSFQFYDEKKLHPTVIGYGYKMKI
jgi:GNAT superfamily N-acetyltransferase